jgi:hypothetical protein
MAQASTPFGLRLAKNQGGVIVRNPERLILISGNGSAQYPTAGALYLPSSSFAPPTGGAANWNAVDPVYVNNIFQNDPIGYGSATGTGTAGTGGVGVITTYANRGSIVPITSYSGAGNVGAILGTFEGVEYSDSSGKRTVSNKWTNPGTFPGSEVWFWFSATSSSDQVYEIQTNATIGQDAIGKTFGIANPVAPNAVTGFSTAALDVSTANGGLVVYALAYDPTLATTLPNQGYAPGYPSAGNNNWGDPYVNVYVKLAKPQFAAAVASF